MRIPLKASKSVVYILEIMTTSISYWQMWRLWAFSTFKDTSRMGLPEFRNASLNFLRISFRLLGLGGCDLFPTHQRRCPITKLLGYLLYILFQGRNILQPGCLLSCCCLFLGKPYVWILVFGFFASGEIYETPYFSI